MVIFIQGGTPDIDNGRCPVGGDGKGNGTGGDILGIVAVRGGFLVNVIADQIGVIAVTDFVEQILVIAAEFGGDGNLVDVSSLRRRGTGNRRLDKQAGGVRNFPVIAGAVIDAVNDFGLPVNTLKAMAFSVPLTLP